MPKPSIIGTILGNGCVDTIAGSVLAYISHVTNRIESKFDPATQGDSTVQGTPDRGKQDGFSSQQLGGIVLGKLYRKSAYAPTRTIDQDLLSALDICLSEKMQCISSLKRNGGGFLIGHIGRFDCHPPLPSLRVAQANIAPRSSPVRWCSSGTFAIPDDAW